MTTSARGICASSQTSGSIVLPVTNAQMCEFIEDGGYDRRELWSEEGWQWRENEESTLPRYWQREQDGFWVRSFGQLVPLDPDKPVCHVSWYEADAYARYADKRLPTEAEWEKAASWDPTEETKRPHPWGDDRPSAERANLDQLAFGTAPVGAYPDGASAYGAQQLIGDVWEWTAERLRRLRRLRGVPLPRVLGAFLRWPLQDAEGRLLGDTA